MKGTGRVLLDDVVRMSVPQRMRTLAFEARRLTGSAELSRLLGEIAAQGRAGQRTAISLAVVGGERDFLLAQLDSTDQELAGRALTGLIRLEVDPTVVVDRLPGASQRTRKSIYRVLGRGGRWEIADALVPALRLLYGDAEAARVLPSCSASVVTEWLPTLAYAVTNWTTLADRHIGPVFDFIETRSRGANRAEWAELWAWATASPVTAAHEGPHRLLALATAAVEFTPVTRLNPVAGKLTRHDPRAMYRLILHPSGNGRALAGPSLWRAMRVLPDENLRQVYLGVRSKRDFLRALPPSRRAAVAGADLARPGVAPASVDLALLDLIPGPARARIARELLSRPTGTDIPAVNDRLTARLTWAEAKPALIEAIRRPTADERAIAYPLLVTAAVGSRDPSVITELLALTTRLRNEQDPVRTTALRAIADIPMSLLTTDHIPGLEQLATDALQARDRSWNTSNAVGTLARTLLLRGSIAAEPAFTATALRIMGGLADLSVDPNLSGLHRNLPRGAEQQILTTLLPHLMSEAQRERFDLCLSLADGLDHRAFDLPDLQRLILRACFATSDSTVRRAVRLALAAPATRDAHLDELFARDRSLITLPLVQSLIGDRRTDLLDALLNTRTSGRFLSGKVVFVPMFVTGFHRWSAHHVDRYARLLYDYARGRTTTAYERASAIRQLGRLPGSVARLTWFVDNGDLIDVEAALTALGASDDPEAAIGVLARYVGDDRARVAVSGIATCARGIAPNRVSSTVMPLLDSPKITARKEAIRLLAELRAPDALPIIVGLATRADAHRDVRRAAVFATRFLLDDERTWALLADATADAEVAGAVLDIRPALLPVPQRQRFAASVRDLAAVDDPRVAAAALSALCSWQRWWAPGTRETIVDRLTDLATVGTWTAAMRALLTAARTEDDATAVVETVRRLRGAEFTAADRDIPAHQRLSAVLDGFGAVVRGHPTSPRVLSAPVVAALADDPIWHGKVIELIMTTIRWTDPTGVVAALEGAATYATGTLVTRPAYHLAQLITAELGTTPETTFHAVGTELARSTAPAIALAALTVIDRCGNKFGWSEKWAAGLTGLRTHPDPDVRRAAHAVFTAPE
ncbi:hypothetical protein [Nocardia caishijiensis]|uniref:HEAT repeat protein n=1 Tax=Nocardia caishijiensis TaxID=184756 RepID=A0ABQ6YNB7_9NOCA|nr:hypothetical protein [Nocardia caishijiensis]KAF0846931.1 hypothetical protein FNL39_104353 [Nocardia caishijiensis]